LFSNISKYFFKTEPFKLFEEKLNSGAQINVTGLYGSARAFFLNYIADKSSGKIVYFSSDLEKLQKVKEDFEVISDYENTGIFTDEKIFDSESNTKALAILSSEDKFAVFIDSSEINEKIISKDKFSDSIIELKKGEEYLFEELIQKLEEYNYSKKDFVEESGDFSVRGGIVDLFPERYDSPLRIEFFGETVDSIREFDITTQRSLRMLDVVRISINLSETEESKTFNTGTVLDYIPDGSVLVFDDIELQENFISKELFNNLSADFKCINILTFDNSEVEVVNFKTKPQPDFHSNIKLLEDNITEYSNNGYNVYIACSDEYQAKRMRNLIEDYDKENLFEKVKVLNESPHNGFISPDARLLLYTEHEIFGRYFRQIKKRKKKFRGITFDELKELRYGDLVVHRDFGIGVYAGLKTIKTGNGLQEVVKLTYADNDIMYLSLNYVNLISKYSANEGFTPKLTRLGGGEWDNLKAKTKKKVQDIARDLILLYAKRKVSDGFAFSPDSHWQRELEASFIYEDTPDQARATEEVKKDMESPNPMDRLVCGDVGFGKTEVAVRAAFKCVLDNKQVAILVPTTILAVQHYNTFRDRLSPFAVETQCITRMLKRKEQVEILKKTEEGKINILIGTHRILSKDIKFKNLGLLIIDEEQKFGVKAKEKLRALSPGVDTLTLTATPIPRTLNFSLLGARDLSVINTPPKNRKPIITEIIRLDWKLIADIIKKELARNGQVYFVNDKIAPLYKYADRIKELIPNAKVGIAHGQMEGNELEDIIVDFIEKKLNVLVCTKIIESGLDIPNVNTIIINNANTYGLSELYQLRGRVGRSSTQAYAYFISPPTSTLTSGAIRRLQAIEEYTDLGSGFNLAMRDMEIRGVGNLLGREQSGFVQQVGFELFMEIIEEAVAELKEKEFGELFKDDNTQQKISESLKKKKEISGIIFENDLNALLPSDYISNETERFNIYKKLYNSMTEDELTEIRNELSDRFGKIPQLAENLFKVVKLKLLTGELGLEKIVLNELQLSLYFPKEKEHRIFRSGFFENLIDTISKSKNGTYNIANSKTQLVIEVKLEITSETGTPEFDEERLIKTEELIKELIFAEKQT